MFNQEMTTARYLDLWLETVVSHSVRYSTYSSYEGYVNNHIKRVIGGLTLSELSPAAIQGLIAHLCKEGKLGARTISIIITMLRNALNCAEEYGLLKNPCRSLRLPKIEEEEFPAFSRAEQTRIEYAAQALAENDTRCYGVLLALYTGVRIGELCALRWENVDFENKCIKIKASLNRALNASDGTKTQMRECEPKTKMSKRTIQLADFLVRLLCKLKAKSIGVYVISAKCGKFVHPRTMQNIYKRLLIQANVPAAAFHKLRHTFATRAAELSADVKSVSVTLGHSNAQITLNRYTHALKEQKQKLMDGLNAYFESKNEL
ncbi:MAG: site-specific integrase [Firmicutes bacterium]|nr:site-specific integrase [Bacillota bacterium]